MRVLSLFALAAVCLIGFSETQADAHGFGLRFFAAPIVQPVPVQAVQFQLAQPVQVQTVPVQAVFQTLSPAFATVGFSPGIGIGIGRSFIGVNRGVFLGRTPFIRNRGAFVGGGRARFIR